MSRAELVALGKEWIEHAPPAGKIASGLRGWTGPVGFVCATCASRIIGRGCRLNTLADVAVWGPGLESCVLCEPDRAYMEKVVAASLEAERNPVEARGTYSQDDEVMRAAGWPMNK